LGDDLRIESRVGSNVETPYRRHNDARDRVRNEWDTKSFVHFAQPLMTRQPPIPCKTPAKPALPCMACNKTPISGSNDEDFQDNGSSLIRERFVEELENGDTGFWDHDGRKVAHDAEEHADGEEPARHEANRHRSHDGNGNHLLGPMDLFGQMGRTIQASEAPIRVHEANDESNAPGLPSRAIDESRKYEFGMLMRGRDSWNCDQNDGERDKRCVQSDLGNCRKRSTVAIDKVANEVGDLVSYEDVPGFDDAVG